MPPGLDLQRNDEHGETSAALTATGHSMKGAQLQRTESNGRQGAEPLEVSRDELTVRKRTRVSIPGGLTYLFLVASGTGLAAFGLNVGLARRRSPDAFSVMPAGAETPVRLGVRALMWGTVCALAGSGVVVAVVGTILHLSGLKLVNMSQKTSLKKTMVGLVRYM